jgi:hypothetical protein
MNSNWYASIAIVGVVVSFLEYSIAEDTAMAYSVLLLTIISLGFLYIYSEIRYYRSHNAILASAQFLLIPSGILVLGNILAPEAAYEIIVRFHISFLLDISARSTETSFLLILPSYMFLHLIRKYYKQEYTGFVVRRRIYRPTKFPLAIHLLLILVLYYSTSINGVMDFVVFVFVLWSVLLLIIDLIVPTWQRNRMTTHLSTDRRRYVRAMTDSPPAASERAISDRRSGRSRQSIPRQSRSGTRTVSVRPEGGYREVSSGNNRNAQAPAAQVDRGITVQRPSKTAKSVPQGKVKKYLPNGHFRRDDLRCMVCYEEFKGGSGNVGICTYCKFPAHERELLEWLSSSKMCPRCSKTIKQNGSAASILKMSEKQYMKIIKKYS